MKIYYVMHSKINLFLLTSILGSAKTPGIGDICS